MTLSGRSQHAVPLKPKVTRHLFVCTNERAEGHPRGCCQSKASEALLRRFKDEVLKKRAALNPEIRIRAQRSGCLDVCEQGPSVVVYPDGVWYGKVKLSDVAEIVESHLIGNKPVERLMIFD